MNTNQLIPIKINWHLNFSIFLLGFLISSCSIFKIFLKDSDGDGIPDRSDKCIKTPEGIRVDKYGCPIDTDRDGIADYMDECPDLTGLGQFNGCPDSDNDGVPDPKDECPNTPKGCKVDNKGCPLDSDGDGVIDCKDQCPDMRGTVFMNGCPEKMVFSRDVVYLPESIPNSSTQCELEESIFSKCKTFFHIYLKLTRALKNTGYSDFRYFLIKESGFALATPIEQIDEDGSPVESLRWSLDKKSIFYDGFNLRSLTNAFLRKHDGHFRSLLFVITSNNISFTPDTENVDSNILESYTQNVLETGMVDLPDTIGKMHVNPSDLNYRLFVYHFVKNEITNKTELLIQDPVTAKNHLIRTKIWEQLEK